MVTQNRNNRAEKSRFDAMDCKRLTSSAGGHIRKKPGKMAVLWESRRRRTKAYLRLRQTLRRRRSQAHRGTMSYRLCDALSHTECNPVPDKFLLLVYRSGRLGKSMVVMMRQSPLRGYVCRGVINRRLANPRLSGMPYARRRCIYHLRTRLGKARRRPVCGAAMKKNGRAAAGSRRCKHGACGMGTTAWRDDPRRAA